MRTDELAGAFAGVEWESLEEIHDAGQKVLESLSDPAVLAELFQAMLDDPRLRGQAERFNLFSKIVLYDDPDSGLRLRLHVFGDQMVEEAHNHRASFVARILDGGYRHLLFGSVEELWRDGDPRSLPPRMVHDQYPACTYALHHAFVHSTLARPNTVSLVIQGPRVRRSFRIVDLHSGAGRTRVGAADTAGAQEAGETRMSRDELRSIADLLTERRIIAEAR